jgi:hypothetical protein
MDEFLRDWQDVMTLNTTSLHSTQPITTETTEIRRGNIEKSIKTQKNRGKTVETHEKATLSEKEKNQWWDCRREVDIRIKNSVETFEKDILSEEMLKLLLGEEMEEMEGFEEVEDDIERLISGVSCIQGLGEVTEIVKIDYDEKKVVELREILKKRGLSGVGKKNELIERLHTDDIRLHELNSKQYIKLFQTLDKPVKINKKGHIILILDENFVNFPIESIPSLKKHSVSRMVNFQSFLNVQKTLKIPKYSINICKSWFIIDCDGNLPETRVKMSEFVREYVAEKKWSWKSYIGVVPGIEVIK